MNSIWNNNYTAFKSRFPQLALITGSQSVPPETFWKLENAKNGMITASEAGEAGGVSVRLHSAYNPEREASGAVGRDEVFEKSAIVFYGFGLGYHVIECAKKILSEKKPNRLVLIEPDIQHFFAAMSLIDWTPVFEVEKLVILVGAPAESVLPLLEDSTRVNIGESGVSD